MAEFDKDTNVRSNEYINKAELMNERPEWLNTNMWNKEKSAHNQGWNECNDEWLNIIKAMPTIEIPEEPHFETEAEGIAYLVGAFSVALDICANGERKEQWTEKK